MKKENVKIKASICIPACCKEEGPETQNDFYENEMEKLFEEIENEIAPKVCDAVSGFVYLAEEVLSVTERNRILELLERLEYEGDGEAALDLLYGMLLAAGLKEHAKAVLDAIHFGEEYQIAYKNDKSDTAVVDVIARAEDASKIQRITERFQLATVDTATVMGGVRDKDAMFPARQTPVKDKLGIEKKDVEPRDGAKRDPSPAKTEKSPLSEPDLKQENRSNGSATGLNSKPSVREKLNDYKVQADAERSRIARERSETAKVMGNVPVPKAKGKER